MITIAPAFKIDDKCDTVLSFTKVLSQFWESKQTQSLELDLRSCEYLGPYAAALVAATYLWVRQRGQACRVQLPDSPKELAAFCSFSGLQYLLSEGKRPRPDHPECETVPVSQFYQAMGNAGKPIVDLVQRHAGALSDDMQTYLHAAYQGSRRIWKITLAP